ncbi:hypothetical protein RRF57_012530 [Xylaria bambusicola]|uniref:Rad60/SUMO-like domain-containing protein n=1 Tax=Xylaria bambusicola TaxID=326684 RepID=A0AAN7ZEX2_9PEZI
MSGENEPGFPRGEDIEAAGGGERLTIKVVDNNNELAFSVTRSTKLAKVISVFLSRRGGDDAATATFTFNDHPLLEDDTADSVCYPPCLIFTQHR